MSQTTPAVEVFDITKDAVLEALKAYDSSPVPACTFDALCVECGEAFDQLREPSRGAVTPQAPYRNQAELGWFLGVRDPVSWRDAEAVEKWMSTVVGALASRFRTDGLVKLSDTRFATA